MFVHPLARLDQHLLFHQAVELHVSLILPANVHGVEGNFAVACRADAVSRSGTADKNG